MIKTLPEKSSANHKFYIMVNSLPSLRLNKSLGHSFSANVSSLY